MKESRYVELAGKLLKNKYVLAVLLLGLVLLLLPTNTAQETETKGQSTGVLSAPEFSLAEEEQRLQEGLSQIRGAGTVRVLLSLQTTASRALAETEGEPLLISGGGERAPVELHYAYPIYQGAVVICSGADQPQVRLDITKAVASFTGLGSDKISVIQSK